MVWQELLNTGFLVGLLASSIRLATPFLLAALGETVAERAGILNIGIEGLMLVGALAGFLGSYYTGSPWVGALCGMLAATLLSALHAVLSIQVAGSQVVSGLAINLLSLGLSTFLIRALFGVAQKEPSAPTFSVLEIPLLSDIPILGPILFRHHFWVFAAFALVPVLWVILFRTPWGLKVTAAGENPVAAESAGVNVNTIRFAAVLIGGALAGLGGMLLPLAQLSYFRENMVSGRGFIALAMVTMGRWHPRGVLFAALIFGVADSMQFRLQATGASAIIPAQLLISLPYVVAILVVLQKVGRQYMPSALAVPYRGSERL